MMSCLKAFWDRRPAVLARDVSAVLIAGALSTSLASAAEESPFYRGKTITIIEGRSPGGTGSLRTQAVVKYLQKYIPGNPSVAYQFIAGGGGIAAANHMVHGVKPDGLTIANIGVSFYSSAILGASGVRYRLDDFVSLGSAYSGGPRVLLVRAGLGLEGAKKTLTEAFNKVWADRQFIEEYERLTGEPADPVTGEEVDRALRQISRDPKVMNTYKQLMAGGPLPPTR